MSSATEESPFLGLDRRRRGKTMSLDLYSLRRATLACRDSACMSRENKCVNEGSAWIDQLTWRRRKVGRSEKRTETLVLRWSTAMPTLLAHFLFTPASCNHFQHHSEGATCEPTWLATRMHNSENTTERTFSSCIEKPRPRRVLALYCNQSHKHMHLSIHVIACSTPFPPSSDQQTPCHSSFPPHRPLRLPMLSAPSLPSG